MKTRKPIGNASRRACAGPSVSSTSPSRTPGSDSARRLRLSAAMPSASVASPVAVTRRPAGAGRGGAPSDAFHASRARYALKSGTRKL